MESRPEAQAWHASEERGVDGANDNPRRAPPMRRRPRRGPRRPPVTSATSRTPHSCARRGALRAPRRRSADASSGLADAERSANVLAALCRRLSAAGRVMVLVSVEALERVVEATVARADEARASIDTSGSPTIPAAAKLAVHRQAIGKLATPFEAIAVANELVACLEPTCARIAIADSIRRAARLVKDIEVVAQPHLERNLFGAVMPSSIAFDRALDDVERDGPSARRRFDTKDGTARTRWGERYKAAIDVASGIPIDLFIVGPPAQWGAILAIRTGPHELSQHLVTARRDRGLRRVQGRLVGDRCAEVATPDERDFFAPCGVESLKPEARR